MTRHGRHIQALHLSGLVTGCVAVAALVLVAHPASSSTGVGIDTTITFASSGDVAHTELGSPVHHFLMPTRSDSSLAATTLEGPRTGTVTVRARADIEPGDLAQFINARVLTGETVLFDGTAQALRDTTSPVVLRHGQKQDVQVQLRLAGPLPKALRGKAVVVKLEFTATGKT